MKKIYNLLVFASLLFLSFGMVSCSEEVVEAPTGEIPRPTDPTIVEGDLILTPSTTELDLNTDDHITFTATCNDESVISYDSFKIYEVESNGDVTLLDGTSYLPEAKGDYTFYARVKLGSAYKTSERVTVKVVASSTPGGNEPDPSNVEYRKHTLAIQFTSVGCGWCPSFIKLIHEYQDENDDVVFVAAHGDMNGVDPMRNSYGTMLMSAFSCPGYPDFRVGSVVKAGATSVGNYTDFSATEDEFNATIQKYLDEPAYTGISLTSVVNGDEVEVSAKVKVTKDGSYAVGTMLLEDGIKRTQHNYFTSSQLDISNIDLNTHYNVLQGLNSAKSPIYVSLGSTSNHTEGSEYEYTYTYDTSKLTTLKDIENCKVVVYTFDKKTNHVDNAIVVPVGESKDYELK